MTDHLAPLALLPDGWAADVHLSVDGSGTLRGVERGASPPPEGSTRLPGIVVPGVPDLHCHAFQRAMAGLTEAASPRAGGGARPDTFWSWRERMYAFLERLGPDDVEAVAAQLYVELLEAGYTAVAEFHYLHHAPDGTPYDDPAETGLRIVEASRTAGMGLTLLPVLYMSGDFGGGAPSPGQRRFLTDVDGVLDLAGRARGALEGDPDRRAGLALHSLRAVPPRALADAVEGIHRDDPGAPVHVHAAEQVREVVACVRWSGLRPVAWLLEHAPVDRRWCVVHATHLDAAEVEGLARSQAVAGLCPTTEADLGDGLFPLPDYLEAGGALGIGSDSNVCTDPAAELRLLEYGQRLRRLERNVSAGRPHPSTGRTLLEAAWAGGSRACGRPIGALAPGRRADWVVLDPDHPTLAGRSGDEVLDAWVFSATGSPVAETWVGGRRVVAGGRHAHRDAVAERYRRVVRDLAAG